MEVEKIRIQNDPVIGSDHPIGSSFGYTPIFTSRPTFIENDWVFGTESFEPGYSQPVVEDGALTCFPPVEDISEGVHFFHNYAYAFSQQDEIYTTGSSEPLNGPLLEQSYIEIEIVDPPVIIPYTGGNVSSIHTIQIGFADWINFNGGATYGMFFRLSYATHSFFFYPDVQGGFSPYPYNGVWKATVFLGQPNLGRQFYPTDGGQAVLYPEVSDDGVFNFYGSAIPTINAGDKMRLEFTSATAYRFPTLRGYINGVLVDELDETWWQSLRDDYSGLVYNEYATFQGWHSSISLTNSGPSSSVDSATVR